MNYLFEMSQLKTPAEQLEYATETILMLTGAAATEANWLANHLILRPKLATVLNVLNNRAGYVVTFSELLLSTHTPPHYSNARKALAVGISQLRRALADCELETDIENISGVGYKLTKEIPVPTQFRAVYKSAGLRWTKQEDGDLVTMVESGSDMVSMVHEMDRDRQDIRIRMRMLGLLPLFLEKKEQRDGKTV